MRLTKRMIDELAVLKRDLDEANKAARAADKAYNINLAPITSHLEEDMKLAVDQTVELRGASSVLEIGKCRKVRSLINPVEALNRLESVRIGLGWESMTIPLKVLDAQLRESEKEDLIEVEYGVRSVKATILP